MGISIDEEVLSHMNLARLAELSREELQQNYRREATDGRYCLEIFRRAIIEHTEQAWSVLHQRLAESVRIWLRSHPYRASALRYETEEDYIALTFSRFWYAVHHQHIEFPSLQSALGYLHATLNGVILDTLRSHARSKDVTLSDPDITEELVAPETGEGYVLWDILKKLLPDQREQRLAYLLYYCGLKPRDIVMRCADEFSDVKEIYRLNHNILEKLRRNRHRLRWLLGDCE